MSIASPSRKPIVAIDKPTLTILRLVESNRTATQKNLTTDKEGDLSDPMKAFCRELIFKYHGDLSRVAEELEVPMSWITSVASKHGLTEGCPRIAKQEEDDLSD
jgi:hypothetical protein